MYELEIGKTDLTVLKQYLTKLKSRTALTNHNKTLKKLKRQLESLFSVKSKNRPAIPWGY